MLRVVDNIHLKKNEVFYRIQSSEQLFKAVKTYGAKLVSNDSNRFLIKISQRLRRRGNLDVDKVSITESLDFGKSNIIFENTSIIVNINQFSKPLINDSGPQFHSEMEVKIIENENTLEENKDIAIKFFKKCGEFYVEEICDLKKEKNKTTIYIWDDGYWETLEKGISRNISTIYLDGLETKIQNQISTFLSKETEDKYEKYDKV